MGATHNFFFHSLFVLFVILRLVYVCVCLCVHFLFFRFLLPFSHPLLFALFYRHFLSASSRHNVDEKLRGEVELVRI